MDVADDSLCYRSRNLATTAAESIVSTAAKDFCLVYVSGLAGPEDGSASSGDSTCCMDNCLDFSGVSADLVQSSKSTYQNRVVVLAILTYYYIFGVYYFTFLI